MAVAFDALAALGVGVQLTPGNHPTPDFEAKVALSRVPTRTHHGFDFKQRLSTVWSDDGCLLVRSDSVHPPRTVGAARFWSHLEQRGAPAILEVMYPGYCLGDSVDLARAMDQNVPLAVDVSHLFLQREAGVLSDAVLRRLLSYEHVAEVHVSANDGRTDSHRLISRTSWGLGWAKERAAQGTPLVFESYLHAVPTSRWREQLELLHD